MFQALDKHYPRIILFGLVLAIWFAALTQAAHDLWSASILFGWVTLLLAFFCLGRFRDRKMVRLPLLVPSLVLLLSLWLTSRFSYDRDASLFEAWGWTFTLLAFYLFLNAAEGQEDRSRFCTLSGLVVIPLAILCLRAFGISPAAKGIGATLINPVVLAGFTLYWTLSFWEKAQHDGRYIWFFLACLVILLSSKSWWAWICLAGGFSVYYVQEVQTWARGHSATSRLIGVLILMGSGTLLLYKIHYQSEHRWFYWLTALRAWRHHPWVGVGLGGFATAYPYYKIGQVQSTLFAHSFPLQLLAETGLLGVAALLFWGKDYLRIRNSKGPASPPHTRLSISDTTTLMILSYSLVTFQMDYLLNKLTFFLFLAQGLVTIDTRMYRTRPLWMTTLLCSAVLLSPLWLSLFYASRLYTAGQRYEAQGDLTNASRLYHDAISLESVHANSYWGLSRICGKRYAHSRAREDLNNALEYLDKAITYKKDPQFFMDLMRYNAWFKTSTP